MLTPVKEDLELQQQYDFSNWEVAEEDSYLSEDIIESMRNNSRIRVITRQEFEEMYQGDWKPVSELSFSHGRPYQSEELEHPSRKELMSSWGHLWDNRYSLCTPARIAITGEWNEHY